MRFAIVVDGLKGVELERVANCGFVPIHLIIRDWKKKELREELPINLF